MTLPTDLRAVLHAAIDKFSAYTPGWAGSDEPAPSPAVCTQAHDLVNLLPDALLSRAQVSPDVEGGLAVYVVGGVQDEHGGWSRWGAVFLTNDGEAALALIKSSRALVVEIAPEQDAGLADAAHRIEAFLLENTP